MVKVKVPTQNGHQQEESIEDGNGWYVEHSALYVTSAGQSLPIAAYAEGFWSSARTIPSTSGET